MERTTHPRLAPLAGRLSAAQAGSWRIHGEALARRAAGEDVIVLSIGEPDFETPPPIVEATAASLQRGRTRYVSPRGEPPLLEAIAGYVSEQCGTPVTADRVVFFPGAQAALFAVLNMLAGPGDEVIVGEPAYTTYHGVIAASGADRIDVPTSPEDGFRLRPAAVAERLTERTRIVLVNTPHNPGGAVLSSAELHELAELCRERGAWLVSDEVYAALTFGRHEHASVLAAGDAEVVSLGSLSKSHAMTGFRHGWAIAPPELAVRLTELLEAMLFGSPPFVQDAGLAALSLGSAITEPMRIAYEERARRLVDELETAPGIGLGMPEGGMFAVADVRGTGLGADAFADRLLDEQGVAVTPLDGFGPSATGQVRISLGAPSEALADAAGRIRTLAGELASER